MERFKSISRPELTAEEFLSLEETVDGVVDKLKLLSEHEVMNLCKVTDYHFDR